MTICVVGDILYPDDNGYGVPAFDEELTFMMKYGIPRPKVTCINIGLDKYGYAACFLV